MALERDVVIRLLLGERTKILAYVYSFLHDHQAADDVFQEISILAIDRCAEIESERHFLGWVRNVARFKALKAHRERRGRPVSLDDEVLELLDGTWQGFDETPARDLVEALRGCLDRLTPSARRLVEMKYVDGLAGAAIAGKLGRQVRSVYTALSRIHRALSECLGARGAVAGGTVDG